MGHLGARLISAFGRVKYADRCGVLKNPWWGSFLGSLRSRPKRVLKNETSMCRFVMCACQAGWLPACLPSCLPACLPACLLALPQGSVLFGCRVLPITCSLSPTLINARQNSGPPTKRPSFPGSVSSCRSRRSIEKRAKRPQSGSAVGGRPGFITRVDWDGKPRQARCGGEPK